MTGKPKTAKPENTSCHDLNAEYSGRPPIVVVGSGLAAYSVIREFRQYDHDQPVTVVTADNGDAYYKPSLSNALAKYQAPDDLVQKSGQDKAEELGITLHRNCPATSIDTARRIVVTSEGDIAYDRLVLATGARQRQLIPQGADPSWIHTVNTLDDYRRWYARLDFSTKNVLLIGAGLIGCEFADDLNNRGIGVHLVDPAPWPLSRLLPEALGVALLSAFAQAGIKLHMGHVVAALQEVGTGGYEVTLDDGTQFHVDLVLSAVGLMANTKLAAEAGLRINDGILVDEQLSTSDPHVHALGDCAETSAGVLPYVAPLMAQAAVLGKVLAGQDATLSMDAMPVTVKTTSLPLIVCPPPASAAGSWQWQVRGTDQDLSAVYCASDGKPLGFALTGGALRDLADLRETMPPLIARRPADRQPNVTPAIAEGSPSPSAEPMRREHIFVTDREGVEHALEAEEGKKVMEIIRDAGLPIEASCGGFCSCGTCHCYIDSDWLPCLPDKQADERDMLEMAFDVNESSRLTCQIIYTGALDGLRLELGPDY